MLAIATFLSCANTVATAEETDSQEIIDEVVVRAHPLSAEGLAQPLVVLESEEIRRRMAPSVGGIVADIPGVNSSSFGQAVG
ncbi:MAG TPA: TonB-dependent receptor, partial [Gammaproteobacteria bacterium]|nr:TonB-dependent receptor [Gammaproteobacteria bacterium]